MTAMRERRAYICPRCFAAKTPYRVFTTPGETKVPRCPQHGAMERQPNKPYRGRRAS